MRVILPVGKKTRFPKCNAWQISAIGKKDFVDELGIRATTANVLLKDLI